MGVRVLLLSAAFLVAAGVVTAADDDPEPPKRGLGPLQGEWVMAAREMKGEKVPQTSYKLTIKGDRWVVTSGKAARAAAPWSIRVDPSKRPMTIDAFVKDGDKE